MIPATNTDIRNAASDGRAFCVRFEYCGYNDKNASGQSQKFWCYERPYKDAPIQVRYGAIGTSGQTRNQNISYWDARERADKKERKGYTQVSMQAEPLPSISAPTPALPPLSEWAATMPAPFNTITAIDSSGRATNASGQLVCNMAPADANTIRAQYSA
jgi:predicted DNA-binding WGR domain protein